MTAKRRELATLLFLAIVPTILFADILFGGNTMYVRDVWAYHFPGKHVIREIVLGGEFPYWSPYISAGQPIAANPVHQIFYPLTWLILLPDFVRGFNLLPLVHLYIATFGMYALLRSMHNGRAAAAFGGLSYGIGGLLVTMLHLFPLLYTAAWLPVTCLFARRLLITRSRRDFAFASLAFAMQLLVGEPVTAVMTGIILGSYALWRRRSKPRSVMLIGAMAVAALMLSMVQTLPAVDHLRDSGRGIGMTYAQLIDWSAPPLRLLEPLFPAILGRWMIDRTHIFPSADLFSKHAQPLFTGIYAGLAVAVFALAGLFARTRGALLFAILAVLSALLAIGDATPFFRILASMGLFRFVRFPEKFLLLGIFAAVIFSACVLQRLLHGDRRIRRAVLAVGGAVSLFALAAAAASYLPAYERLLRRLYLIDATAPLYGMIELSRKEWLFAATRGAVLVLLVVALFRIRRELWLALFATFVAVDLLPQVRDLAPAFPRAFLEAPPIVHRLAPNRGEYRIFPFADLVRHRGLSPKFGEPGDLRTWILRNELPVQVPTAYGFRTVIDGDLDASDLRPEGEFLEAVLELMEKENRPPDWMEVIGAMSNAWYIGMFRRPEEIAAMQPPLAREPVHFVEVGRTPRYYFASELVTIRDRHDFVRALRTRRHSRQAAFIHQPPFRPAPGRVLAVRETANTARIDVATAGPAFLVMTVTPHKYWRVTIDGIETNAVVTNIGFQGVPVPPGRHVVEMRYRNPLIAAGAAVSAAALLGLALLFRRR